MLLNRAVGVAGLAALLSSMPSCVIPAAPDFQDPVSFPQVAPWIHDESPPFGQVVSVLASNKEGVPFSVLVTDLNVDDALYARWVVNPAPGSSNPTLETVTLTTGDREKVDRMLPTVTPISVQIKCDSSTWQTNPAPQQLELIVADGEFTGPIDMVDTRKTRRSYANWTIALECSSAPGASP